MSCDSRMASGDLLLVHLPFFSKAAIFMFEDQNVIFSTFPVFLHATSMYRKASSAVYISETTLIHSAHSLN